MAISSPACEPDSIKKKRIISRSRKLVDLEDRSSRNNLRILGIKEDPREEQDLQRRTRWEEQDL